MVNYLGVCVGGRYVGPAVVVRGCVGRGVVVVKRVVVVLDLDMHSA